MQSCNISWCEYDTQDSTGICSRNVISDCVNMTQDSTGICSRNITLLQHRSTSMRTENSTVQSHYLSTLSSKLSCCVLFQFSQQNYIRFLIMIILPTNIQVKQCSVHGNWCKTLGGCTLMTTSKLVKDRVRPHIIPLVYLLSSNPRHTSGLLIQILASFNIFGLILYLIDFNNFYTAPYFKKCVTPSSLCLSLSTKVESCRVKLSIKMSLLTQCTCSVEGFPSLLCLGMLSAGVSLICIQCKHKIKPSFIGRK